QAGCGRTRKGRDSSSRPSAEQTAGTDCDQPFFLPPVFLVASIFLVVSIIIDVSFFVVSIFMPVSVVAGAGAGAMAGAAVSALFDAFEQAVIAITAATTKARRFMTFS